MEVLKKKELKFMQYLAITPLEIPGLLETALTLPSFGYLEKIPQGYYYLNIDDAYIHQLFPFVQNKKIEKPDYFEKYTMGAHITVSYPEEKIINEEDLNKNYHFEITGAFSSVIDCKRYYALAVASNSLLQIRRKNHLPDQLNFKNHAIGLHITFAVEKLSNQC